MPRVQALKQKRACFIRHSKTVIYTICLIQPRILEPGRSETTAPSVHCSSGKPHAYHIEAAMHPGTCSRLRFYSKRRDETPKETGTTRPSYLSGGQGRSPFLPMPIFWHTATIEFNERTMKALAGRMVNGGLKRFTLDFERIASAPLKRCLPCTHAQPSTPNSQRPIAGSASFVRGRRALLAPGRGGAERAANCGTVGPRVASASCPLSPSLGPDRQPLCRGAAGGAGTPGPGSRC